MIEAGTTEVGMQAGGTREIATVEIGTAEIGIPAGGTMETGANATLLANLLPW